MNQEKEIKEMNKKTPGIPLPACIVGADGKIESANEYIVEVFPFGGVEDQDFFALTGVRLKVLKELASKEETEAQEEAQGPLVVERNNRKFSVTAEAVPA